MNWTLLLRRWFVASLLCSGLLVCASRTNAAPPQIFGFQPGQGSPGTSVAIFGRDFLNAQEVRFDLLPSIFTVVDNSLIVATVPVDAISGPVSVRTAAGRTTTSFWFFVAPRIVDFFPTAAAPGTAIVIDGANFVGITEVSFNGVSTTKFAVTSDTQLQAIVPAGATSGKIQITNPIGVAVSQQNFVLAGPGPFVSEFLPRYGVPGNTVTIFGGNFSGATSVRFNGQPASFSRVADTQITATIPAGATTGPITVATGKGAATSLDNFLVTAAPLIFSASPAAALPGSTVVLDGANFIGATSVKFNGKESGGFAITAPTQLHAIVPAGASTGRITVTNPSGTGTNDVDFVVSILPVISDFSPRLGPAGSDVTILGSNFNGLSAVKFNGIDATQFALVAANQIRVQVPAGATSGRITVTTSAGTGVSPADFGVVLKAPIITSFSPAAGLAGTEVVIDGANFFGATNVSFNGVSAAFSVTAASQILTTVPEAALSGPISVKGPGGAGVSTGRFVAAPRIASFTPTNGVAGVTVRITGTNLLDVTDVKFGGANAGHTNVSATEITAQVPADAATETISVTSAAGIVASTNLFFVLPNIVSFAPSSGPAGTVVTISGTGFGGASAVRFHGVGAAFNIVSRQEIRATVPVGATTGPITIVTASGQATSRKAFVVGTTANLAVQMQLSPGSLLTRVPATLKVAVTNQGPSAANSVVVTNSLPQTVQFNSVTANQGSVSQSGGRIIWQTGRLAAQAGATLTVVFVPVDVGGLTVEAAAGSELVDPDLSDNQSVLQTNVTLSPNTLFVQLSLPDKVILSWPVAATNFVLETSSRVGSAAAWSAVPGQPVVSGNERKLTLPARNQEQYFRLHKL